MDEIKFEKWKVIRAKGFLNYFLKYVILLCCSVLAFFMALNYFTQTYAPIEALSKVTILLIVLIILALFRWFINNRLFLKTENLFKK